MPAQAFPAPTVIHLAIQDGQDRLTRALRRLRRPVIRVAALAVRPEPELAQLRPLAERADAWIFASSNAVRCLAPVAATWRWPPLLLSQGPGTRQALAAFGRDSLMPESPYDSEAMLRMPHWATLAGGLVLRISGASGREWLLTELQQRGIDARAVSVYRRLPVPIAKAVRARVQALATPPVVVVTSAEALHAAQAALAGDWQHLQTGLAIVPSARLAALAQALGFARVALAASATQADVVAAVRAQGLVAADVPEAGKSRAGLDAEALAPSQGSGN